MLTRYFKHKSLKKDMKLKKQKLNNKILAISIHCASLHYGLSEGLSSVTMNEYRELKEERDYLIDEYVDRCSSLGVTPSKRLEAKLLKHH